jgi:hypothetical protein
MTVDLSRLDVPLPVVEAEAKHLLAEQQIAAILARAAWLVEHPDWPTGAATDGMRTEMRHWVEPLLDYTRRPQAAAS